MNSPESPQKPLDASPVTERFSENEGNQKLHPEMQKSIAIWLTLGRANHWIRQAPDPPFDMLSFVWWETFNSRAWSFVLSERHKPGDAAVIEELCLIQKQRCEWLVCLKKEELGAVFFPTVKTLLEPTVTQTLSSSREHTALVMRFGHIYAAFWSNCVLCRGEHL